MPGEVVRVHRQTQPGFRLGLDCDCVYTAEDGELR